MFLLCGLLFIAGCVICALTSSWTLFLIGRGLSAFSVASQIIAYGLIRDLLPRKYVPLGIGAVGAGLGFSGAIAPLIGGALMDHYSWRSMFWFLAIFTVVLTPIVAFVVPETKLRVRQRVAPIGVLMLSVGALLVLLYVDNGQTWGWGRITSLAWLIGGAVLLVGFFVVELNVRHPIMDMRLLLNPKVSLTLLMTFFGVMIVAVQPLALGYMTQTPDTNGLRAKVVQGAVDQAQQMYHFALDPSAVHVTFNPGYSYGNGFTTLQYALHVGIWAGLISVIFGPLGGLWARRIGGRTPAIVAFVVLTISGLGFALVHYSWATYAALYVFAGIGFGLFYSAGPNLLVDAVPPEQQGISAGMFGVVSSMGSAIGISVATALLNNHPVVAHISAMGQSRVQKIPQVFADRGYNESFWIVLGTTLVGLVIVLAMRHGRKPATGGEHVGEAELVSH
jgi:MFS family permease